MIGKPRTAPGVALLVIGTAALAATAIAAAWTPPHVPALMFWALLAIAAELMWIRLPVGGATISMASCPQFAMLLILPPGHAMLITAVTGAAAEALVLRKPPPRVLFNAAQSALAVGAAAWLFGATGGRTVSLPALLGEGALLPVAIAACAYFVLNTGAVSLAVALDERVSPLAVWRRNFGHGYEGLACAAMLSLGALLASHYVSIGTAGTILVALPVLLAYQGYRLAALLREHRRQMEESDERRAA
jgi:hypothetical protein